MELERFDIIKQINLYSVEDNQEALIKLLCNLLDNPEFAQENKDLVNMIISVGELYGYYKYVEGNNEFGKISDSIRKEQYKSKTDNIYYNSGQLSLLNEIKLKDKLFISAPTTFGKTKLVLDYIAMEKEHFNNILFILPTNSLSEEIYIKLLKFNKKYSLSYNVTINPKIKSNKNILILTPEKYLLLLESKNIDFDLYIMDEAYKIEDEIGENYFDDPLNTRSSKFRRIMDEIAKKDSKVIYLSPFTYEASKSMNNFFEKYEINNICRRDTYVDKDYIKVSDSRDYKKMLNNNIKGYTKYSSGVDKAIMITKEIKDTTIVYVRHPKDACDFVMKFESSFDIDKISDRFKKFINHIQDKYEFDNSNWYVLDGLRKGIGVYVSPIPRYIKREIINLFNNGELNILVVTSAFAEGVNSSAKNIIITNSITGANKQLTPLELLNLSGRAGRFGVHSKGNVYLVTDDIYQKLDNIKDKGVIIKNSNYEFSSKLRSSYDLEIISDDYLNSNELIIKNNLFKKQHELGLTDDDLNVALSISKRDKLLLYDYFKQLNDDTDIKIRKESIDNILSSEKNKIISSINFIFDDLKKAQIEIKGDKGDIPPYSGDNFLWGKFYGIHSSGNIKEILKNRKKYIENELKKHNYNLIKESWIDKFITKNEIDNFKLYNQAFKFISNIIEYRIPFYIGFYVSMFELFCKKNNLLDELEKHDIVDISNVLENKNIDDEYNNLLDYGFPIDMVKRIQESKNINVLDNYELLIFNEYKSFLH